ncbi:UvrD-helicase domain-containing protein [Shewanella sp. 10N.286.51.B2]|uniref:UvrD-helicase domain-containing protein n=1 Tax=Shewanella sp. 10N.286.51.B2 TaxID=3229707 RepID=UPI003553F04A
MLPEKFKKSEKTIKHSWFGRLYLGAADAIKLSANGIEFRAQQGRLFRHWFTVKPVPQLQQFTWQQLVAPAEFTPSFLGSLLRFQAQGQFYQVPFLGYFSNPKFKQDIEQYWAQAHEQQLCELVARIEHTLANKYLRQSLLGQMQPRIKREYRRWFPWCKSAGLSVTLNAALVKLSGFYHWNNAKIAQIRSAYVDRQLVKYADFFDNVESKPLTDKQRRACVIDDDNNLLLAGAGTGKTSVMVGRAGYLVASGQAQAADILLLAYGRKAADEMDDRIKQKLATDAIKASTFHSLGLRIIAAVEGKQPSLSPLAEDDQAKEKWLQLQLDYLLKDEVFRKRLCEFFSQYYYVEKSPFDFESEGEYFQYLTDNDIRTLKGERVKSFGELYIANWLFKNGIEYRYEAKYEHDVSSVDFRQYQPDFYLPEYDVYIEYYGIDEANNTASYIDNQAYLESIQWKRELHQQHDTACIELFYYQHKKGQLTAELQQALTAFELQYAPLPDDAILATLNELGRVTELAKLFSQLIGLYKAACLDNKGLDKLFNQATDPKQSRKAFELLQPILTAYQQQLAANGDIDFEDMIAKALNYIQTGQFISPWRYIMVDEFQDISEPRARLVKALTQAYSAQSKTTASLFCVGDDWQAIYRFSGADVSLTTHFSDYFGAAATSYLDQTFRFNSSIGDVATQFVTQNPAQLKKQIRSNVTVTQAAVSVIKRGEHEAATADNPSPNALAQALSAISARVNKLKAGAKQPTVYLLARFWFQLPDSNALRLLNQQYSNITIECQSFHGAKGKEADYVVIMGMKTGQHGFPSNKIIPPLLDAFLAKEEDFKYAEERRLFYVALTRAKHRAYVLADMTDVSPFVTELIQDGYAIEQAEFTTSIVQRLFEDINCVRCTTGVLKQRTGNFKSFYSCCHFPLCDHKEEGCELCASPMTRKRFAGFKVCLNDQCAHTTPLCSVCGADMVLRKSARGEFWGCKNYRGSHRQSSKANSRQSCTHAVDKAKLVLPKSIDLKGVSLL